MSQFLDLHCNLKLQIYLSYTLNTCLCLQSTITSVGILSCNMFEDFSFGGSKSSFQYNIYVSDKLTQL